jgi:hypothetical protein
MAPDLILKADGSLDLPAGQPEKGSAKSIAPRLDKRIYWGRTLLVLVLTVAVWFLSVAVFAAFIDMT